MKRSTVFERGLLFVDTWGWLVLADRLHPLHNQAVQLRRSHTDQGGRLITTDYVLDESITRLFSRHSFAQADGFCTVLFAGRRAGVVQVEAVTPERFNRAYELRRRYRDKPRISFTDLTSFVVMKELGIRRVLTGDAHFTQVHLGFQVVP